MNQKAKFNLLSLLVLFSLLFSSTRTQAEELQSQSALDVPNWEQVNVNGFGNQNNEIITALFPFGGYLYAGAFNTGGTGAQLWRMDTSGNWNAVMTNGFGDVTNLGIDHLIEFNGMLYAGTWNGTLTSPYYLNGGQVWRSSDGSSWEQVVSNGFGDPTNSEVMRFVVFKNQIYAGTWSYSDTDGAEIWRSSSGESGSWTKVVSNGFGEASNRGIVTMEVFNGALYAGTRSRDGSGNATGAEIWRSTNGSDWTRVSDGFGDIKTDTISGLESFNDYLYAGTGRWDSATQTYIGGQIWRCSQVSGCDDVSDWQLIMDDGFGEIQNRYIGAFAVFTGQLYTVTYNRQSGLAVWRTANGTNWKHIVFNGFGDSNNLGPFWDSGIATFNNQLFVGTANTIDGGEIWQLLPTFQDVNTTYWAWQYIERLYNAGITGGCTTSPLNYCPDSTVTRAQMAVFLLKGVHGSSYSPPAVGSSTGFADVPTSYWAAPWIKQLAAEGITGGCGGGNFCPDTPVTRAQMAVFLLKSKHGVSYNPPAATGVFTDVPVGYWADKWIEQLAAEGITGGCGGGNYCPDTSVTRAQMAVFLVKTFNLP
ncbi:MAG: hypothetical protein C3F07_03570 [Anaerolineales bacterium]|nr:MAG: hypothetical protein C3F07_03570 [Anaerolineales bacterium]